MKRALLFQISNLYICFREVFTELTSHVSKDFQIFIIKSFETYDYNIVAVRHDKRSSQVTDRIFYIPDGS